MHFKENAPSYFLRHMNGWSLFSGKNKILKKMGLIDSIPGKYFSGILLFNFKTEKVTSLPNLSIEKIK